MISLLMAAALGLGGMIAEPASFRANVGKLFSPVVESKIRSPDFLKDIPVFNIAVMNDGGSFKFNAFRERNYRRLVFVLIVPNVSVWPNCRIRAIKSVSNPAINRRVEISGVSFHYQNIIKNCYFIGGALAVVNQIIGYSNFSIFRFIYSTRLYGKVGSQLSFGTFPVLPQVDHQKIERSGSYDGLNDHSIKIKFGPFRRFLLGDKVSFLSLIFLVFVGIGLVISGFGKFIDKAVDSRHYMVWGVIGYTLTMIGAGLIAVGFVGLLSI